MFFQDEVEALDITRDYDLQNYLPEFIILGLKSWDDFILRRVDGAIFSLPTVPLVPAHLSPFQIDFDLTVLKPDPKFRGKIKWYIQPIIFGGDPLSDANITWANFEQHAQLVRFWNKRYRDMKDHVSKE